MKQKTQNLCWLAFVKYTRIENSKIPPAKHISHHHLTHSLPPSFPVYFITPPPPYPHSSCPPKVCSTAPSLQTYISPLYVPVKQSPSCTGGGGGKNWKINETKKAQNQLYWLTNTHKLKTTKTKPSIVASATSHSRVGIY